MRVLLIGLFARCHRVRWSCALAFSHQRNRLDADVVKAWQLGTRTPTSKHALGLFLALTTTLGGAPFLLELSSKFKDGHMTSTQLFFLGAQSKLGERLAKQRTPALAQAWGWTMNQTMEDWRSVFDRFSETM